MCIKVYNFLQKSYQQVMMHISTAVILILWMNFLFQNIDCIGKIRIFFHIFFYFVDAVHDRRVIFDADGIGDRLLVAAQYGAAEIHDDLTGIRKAPGLYGTFDIVRCDVIVLRHNLDDVIRRNGLLFIRKDDV